MNNEVEKIKRLGQGQRIAWIASLLTLLLAIVKGAVGYRFDSPLLVADAVHSAGDVVTIAASGFGLWLAARKKSEKFPYGLYKAETLAGLFIGALVLWAGVEMAREGYAKLLHSSTAPGFPVLPVIATILSIIINYFLAKKEKEVGKFINSQSLQIKAYDTLLDIYVSCAVLIGLLLAFLGIPYAEGGLIMAISLLILKLGAETVWVCLLSLLDANLDPELQAEIVGKVAGINGVRECRSSGFAAPGRSEWSTAPSRAAQTSPSTGHMNWRTRSKTPLPGITRISRRFSSMLSHHGRKSFRHSFRWRK